MKPALLALTLGVLSTHAYAQTSEEPQYGGTAIVISGSEPSVLNAVISTSPPDALIGCMVYEGLVSMNGETNEPQPALADSWTVSEDGRTYTFHLRDAKWHDGQDVTADDVVYTLTKVTSKLSPTFAAQVGDNLQSVTALDDHTVELKLGEPFGPLMLTLTCSLSGGILPKHIYEGTDPRTNEATVESPIGTGAFTVTDWARGDHITLSRFDDYWDEGKPYLDGLVVSFVPNPASRTQALLSGQADFIGMTQFPVNDAALVERTEGYKLESTGWPPNSLWGFFNLERAPFNDKSVRQALLMATDRDYILQTAFSGRSLKGDAPWTKQLPWAMDAETSYDATYPFDYDAANALLDEAGYPADEDGVRFHVGIYYDSSNAERNVTTLALQGMWRNIGVIVDPMPTETAVLLPLVHDAKDFDLYIASYSSFGDPAIGISRGFISSTIGRNFGNASGYANPEVDQLFFDAASKTSVDERAALYHQILPILMDDLPSITLHDNKGVDAAADKLHGLWGGYLGDANWPNGWLEQ